MKCALVVMAKAPIANLAKTRLIPALGASGAALLAQQLLQHTIVTCMQASLFEHTEICVTPDRHHVVFDAMAKQYGKRLTFSEQGQGDIGLRMLQVFERLLQTYSAVVVVGTDAPSLSSQTLDQAASMLKQYDAVLVPALDGGYALIGLKKVLPEVFLNMMWSTPTVMHVTGERLDQAGWSVYRFAPVADVDDPADLKHLPAGWST